MQHQQVERVLNPISSLNQYISISLGFSSSSSSGKMADCFDLTGRWTLNIAAALDDASPCCFSLAPLQVLIGYWCDSCDLQKHREINFYFNDFFTNVHYMTMRTIHLEIAQNQRKTQLHKNDTSARDKQKLVALPISAKTTDFIQAGLGH